MSCILCAWPVQVGCCGELVSGFAQDWPHHGVKQFNAGQSVTGQRALSVRSADCANAMRTIPANGEAAHCTTLTAGLAVHC